MEEEREELLRRKIEEISGKMKEKEERSLLNMKQNAENNDNKIKKIIKKSVDFERNLKSKKK